jgi:hypothetical protein
MKLRQSLIIWAATLAVVLLAAAFAWIDRPAEWIIVGPPSAPLPDRVAIPTPRPMPKERLLIVVENTPQARPQSGLADACLVFEMPTEGLITRFLLSYCDAGPTVVGPVRSARRYMLEIASDLGAVLVHAGSSAEALAMIRTQRLPVLNQFWTPEPFWRDASRQMPHNLYTGMDRLQAAMAGKPYGVQPSALPFGTDAPLEADAANGVPGAPATDVSLDFGPLYAVRYVYQAETKRYLRMQDGRPHLDAGGRQIAPTSVLVLFIRWSEIQVNDIPSSRIDLTGTGRLVMLHGGTSYEGTWTRPALGPLILRDAAGHPVTLPGGAVWIELFPTDRPFTVLPVPKASK